jgi:PilZ domain
MDLVFRASLRERGASKFDITVKDLSVTGFQCETSFMLRVGGKVWLTIPGLQPLESEVVWADSYRFGCAFLSPLNAAVLDHIAKQSRPA